MSRLKIILILFIAAILGLVLGAAFFYGQKNSVSVSPVNKFFVDPELIAGLTQAAPDCLKQYQPEKITGGIVNHHLLATDLLEKFFCRVANKEIKTVIILSPNHFARGSGWAIVSSNDWLTPQGELRADKSKINEIVISGLVSDQSDPFLIEHGVGNLIPLVKVYLPQAKVVPIIIKDGMPADKQQQLVSELEKIIDNQTIIIASLDFSHDLTLAEAEERDKQTLPILNGLAYDQVASLNSDRVAANVDSLSVLNIFLRLLAAKDAKNFALLGQGNSAVISGQLSATSTTSYFTAVYLVKK